ncbi:MAG: diacylglycerol kinase family lipid kinase [candidate division KSB1 bacterium]|nr:diacylglycerol kinase family lipid kinase [candidate division KSB1 bacterium]
MIAAVGGDGTINEVTTALVHSTSALGIIPTGSGNGLARSLKLPLHPDDALQALKTGVVKTIDLGRAGERYFCTVSGAGIDAVVGDAFDRTSWRGPLPYFFISARELWRYKPGPMTLHIDGEAKPFTPFLLTCANGQQFGNGAIIAPRARFNDGLLDLCLVPNISKWRIVSAVPMLFNGTLDRHPHVTYYKIKKLVIEKEGEILYHVDGEPVVVPSPLTIEIVPQALKVVVSPNSDL